MFINKVVNDVLGFSCLPMAALGLICMAIIRFHMLKKIERNIGGKIKFPKEWERMPFKLPFYLAVGSIIFTYFLAHLLTKLGMKWHMNNCKRGCYLLQIDYPISNFSWVDKFVFLFFIIAGICSLTVAGLIYFKIIT